MKYRSFILCCLIFLPTAGFSQKHEIIYLWPDKVPGEKKEKAEPRVSGPVDDNVIRYDEVTNPLIEVFIPESSNSNGAGVIVCPGGAYRILAYNKEGTEIAAWLNKIGYAAFVLQYRVPDKKEGALQDAQRALRIVKSNAGKWKINPDQIGIMGFSAGGSLSARCATSFYRRTYPPVDNADSLSCRPAFALLIYPAYLDQGPGNSLTPELTLSKYTPPMFIFQTADDQYGNSAIVMAAALRNAKIPVELHILPYGGHGYGLRPGKDAAETWPVLAEKWLLKTIVKTTN